MAKKISKKKNIKKTRRAIPKRTGRPVEHDFSSIKSGECVEQIYDTKQEAEKWRIRINVSARRQGYNIVTRIIPTGDKFNFCYWLHPKK